MTILMTSGHNSFLWYSTVLLLIISSAKSQCTSGTCEKTFISITTDTKQNSFLDGYVFETLNVSIWKECAEMCLSKCQCLSFNFNGAKQTKNCELNDANTKLTPGALKEKEGVSYYEPVRTYNDKNVSRFVFGLITGNFSGLIGTVGIKCMKREMTGVQGKYLRKTLK